MKKTFAALSLLTLSLAPGYAQAQIRVQAAAAASGSVEDAIKIFQELLSQTDRSDPKAIEKLQFLVIGLMSAQNFIQKESERAACQK